MLYVNPLASKDLGQAANVAQDPVRRKEALQELEQYFLYMLLQEMHKTVPQPELFGKSQAQEVWKDMMNDALAGAMAESGQFGIAREMERQLAVQDQAVSPASLPGGAALRPLNDTQPRRILPEPNLAAVHAPRLDVSA